MSSVADHSLAIVLLVAYALLLALTVVLFARLLFCSDSAAPKPFSWKPRFTFLLLILLLSSMRIALFCLLLLDQDTASWYFWALFDVCALLYLTLFTELMLFWARVHDSLRPAEDGSMRFSNRQRRTVQAVSLLVAWLVYVGLFVFFFFEDYPLFTAVVSYVTCGFFALAALFFAVYGTLIYRRMRGLPVRSPAVTSRIRRVLAVAVIVTAAFGARAVLNAVLPSLLNAAMTEEHSWVVYTAAFLGTEVLPLLLVELLVVVPFARRDDDDVESSVRKAYQKHYSYHAASKLEAPVN